MTGYAIGYAIGYAKASKSRDLITTHMVVPRAGFNNSLKTNFTKARENTKMVHLVYQTSYFCDQDFFVINLTTVDAFALLQTDSHQFWRP